MFTTQPTGTVISRQWSLRTYDIWQRLVHSRNTTGPADLWCTGTVHLFIKHYGSSRPTMCRKSLFNHKTPWVCTDPQRTGMVHLFIKHHGYSRPTMFRKGLLYIKHHGSCRPMVYRKSLFIHKTPWVHSDPWHMGAQTLWWCQWRLNYTQFEEIMRQTKETKKRKNHCIAETLNKHSTMPSHCSIKIWPSHWSIWQESDCLQKRKKKKTCCIPLSNKLHVCIFNL